MVCLSESCGAQTGVQGVGNPNCPAARMFISPDPQAPSSPHLPLSLSFIFSKFPSLEVNTTQFNTKSSPITFAHI
jgi:hypothetical protein